MRDISTVDLSITQLRERHTDTEIPDSDEASRCDRTAVNHRAHQADSHDPAEHATPRHCTPPATHTHTRYLDSLCITVEPQYDSCCQLSNPHLSPLLFLSYGISVLLVNGCFSCVRFSFLHCVKSVSKLICYEPSAMSPTLSTLLTVECEHRRPQWEWKCQFAPRTSMKSLQHQ